ncbi:MAG TPA: enolase C-terminal domain-like protein [Nitrososphaerales archaeon]|nr:enolase C-terminal domain-like protein [Nitrososphaerales archaeon]HUK74230.1 enolase C-terminal domain-like protein [Nitrososphaerales archaeon]
MKIQSVRARVCFNGRGDPGIEADVMVDGEIGRALSPSGASRGTNEAVPFVDDDPYKTASQFNSRHASKIKGIDAADPKAITDSLRKLDGTRNYSKIGGSLAYAVSVAAAQAEANARGLPLCRVIDAQSGPLPFPLGNTIGGGKHASDLSPAFQEILVAPVGARTILEAIQVNFNVHAGVGKKLSKMLDYPVGKGDEGGWSPGLTDVEALGVVESVVGDVKDATGVKIRIGVDVAADSLYDPKKKGYYYRTTKKTLSREEQMVFISELHDRYDLLYIEDPLYEDDFEGYAKLHASLKGTLITGDDLYTTDVGRLKVGVSKKSTNGVIMKVNQIGTLWEAQEFSNLAKETGHVVIASHRSGDNEGGHLAHFAVGFGCGLIKSGVVGGERTSKLNELLRIGEALGTGAKMATLKA